MPSSTSRSPARSSAPSRRCSTGWERSGGSPPAELEIDGWRVLAAQGRLTRAGETVHLEPRVMDLLTHLAAHPGEVVSRDEILREVWSGAFVGDNALHTAVSALRKAFRDDPRSPRVLETIPRRGYRLLARVVRRRSIAVLPFLDLSDDPGQDFFSEGMTDALIGELGRCAELDVISRQSVMAYRQPEEPLPVIADRLGAELIVEGSVLRVGERVRLIAQLLEASHDRHLWSERYERDLEDVLELQRELALAIATAVLDKVTPLPVGARPAVHPEALIHHLRGRYHFYRLAPEHFERALGHFREAVRIEPLFGDAHAGIADVYGAYAYWGLRSPSEMESQVSGAVATALRADPQSADARALYGQQLLFFERDLAGAEEQLGQALSLNRSSVQAHLALTLCLSAAGRSENGLAVAERGTRLDPLNPAVAVARAMCLMNLDRYDEAREVLREALEIDSRHGPSHQMLADLHWFLEDESSAFEHEAAWWSANGGPIELLHQEGGAKPREAIALAAERLEAVARERYVQPIELARLYAHGHETEKALDWLEEAERSRDLRLVDSFRLGARWEAVREHPRFERVGRALGLPGY